jgi:hypothetical protein
LTFLHEIRSLRKLFSIQLLPIGTESRRTNFCLNLIQRNSLEAARLAPETAMLEDEELRLSRDIELINQTIELHVAAGQPLLAACRAGNRL